MNESVCEKIDSVRDLLEEVSHKIWSHPELNHEEKYAHQVLTDALQDQGFQVQRHYCLPTAFRAEFSNNRRRHPVIAVLCEYDALPEIGHACGHNLIAEAGLGAGIAIKDVLQKDASLPGTVVVLGTPAEEGGGGKIDLIKAGAFQDIDICMMVHPAASNVINTPFIGFIRLDVQFKGLSTHACASPWEGLNALDAAVLCYNGVSVLRQQMKPSCKIHGVITKGGVSPSIIPSESEMVFYVRGTSTADIVHLQGRLTACFQAAAQATGCQALYQVSPGYKALITNSVVAAVFRKHAEQLGVKFEDNNPRCKTFTASSDVGDVSYEIPTIQPLYSIGTQASNHSESYCAAAGSPQAQPYTLTMAKAMACAGLELMLNPELIDLAKAQHARDMEQDLCVQ